MKIFSKTVVIFAFFALVGCATLSCADFFEPVNVRAGAVFDSAAVANLNGAVELRWTYEPLSLEAGIFSGVRVYRLRDGDEMSYRVEPLVLVEDVGTKDRVRVTGLRNGSRTIFLVRAYDETGKDVEEIRIFGFPGANAKDIPTKVENLYTAPGPFAISVFWDQSADIDLAGYKVLRRRFDEDQFAVLGRLDKIVQIDGQRTGAVLRGLLPEIQPTMFRDRTALPGLKYVYQVRAVTADGKIGPGVETEEVSLVEDRSPIPAEVLILAMWGSSDSRDVARYYASKRRVPEKNILVVSPFTGNKYKNDQIVEEVRKHLLKEGLAGKIRVIVPTFGIPLGDWHRALDSVLADPFGRFAWGRVMGTPNPSFGQNMHHDPSLGTYLVSRLDGPTSKIAMGLVDKAMEAEKIVTPRSGSAFFTSTAFGKEGMLAANRHGVQARLEDRNYTASNKLSDQTMWMFADGHDYKNIRISSWPLGSVAGFLKSNTLAKMENSKYSYWVPGLLEEGVTATFGANIEPYVQGYTRGDILLDRFWSGRYTFAEAFSMATPTLRWAMCAVGDPLYKILHEKK